MDRNATKSMVSGAGWNRRTFVRDALGSSLAAGSLAALAGCLDEVDRRDDEGEAPIRRCIASLQQDDPDDILKTFKEGVEAMRDLDEADSRQWDNVVDVHLQADHRDWYFLPWHRAYIFYFEEIIRELTGNDRFALPYWNWIDNPALPAIFGDDWYGESDDGDDDGDGNPLYNGTRDIAVGADGRDDDWVDQDDIADVMAEPNFLAFGGTASGSGALESPPHDHVHGQVGGDMAFLSQSPNDPVFWVHHCMVDYLWWDWNANRGNPNTNDSDWWTETFDGQFVDGEGETVEEISVATTVVMDDLSFQYEGCSSGATGPLVEIDDSLREFLRTGAEVDFERLDRTTVAEDLTVRAAEPTVVETDAVIEDLLPYTNGTEPGRVTLTAHELRPPARGDFRTAVYLNRTDPVENPARNDTHVAGHVEFFTDEEHRHEYDLTIDVSDALASLAEDGALDGEETMDLQFASAPIREGASDESFEIGELRVEVVRSVIDGEVVERRPER